MSPLSKPKIIILLVNEKQVCWDWRKVFEICIRSPFVGHKSQKLSSWERCMNCERTKQIIKIKYFNILNALKMFLLFKNNVRNFTGCGMLPIQRDTS